MKMITAGKNIRAPTWLTFSSMKHFGGKRQTRSTNWPQGIPGCDVFGERLYRNADQRDSSGAVYLGQHIQTQDISEIEYLKLKPS